MYSNCLIEALKAKIKDPKNVAIHKIPANLNNCGGLPHFWWSVGETGFDYKKENGKCKILFKGKIRSLPVSSYKAMIQRGLERTLAKKAEKYGVENPIENYKFHFGPINIEAKNYFIIESKDGNKNDVEVKVRIVNKRDLDHYKIDYWRPCFEEVEDFSLNYDSIDNEDGLSIF